MAQKRQRVEVDDLQLLDEPIPKPRIHGLLTTLSPI